GCVKVWVFHTPQVGLLHRDVSVVYTLSGALGCGFCRLGCRIVYPHRHARRVRAVTGHLDYETGLACANIGSDMALADVGGGHGGKGYVLPDAADVYVPLLLAVGDVVC